MSEELRQPPVIDLEVLLQPISDENPSGESLRYSGIYDQIAEARRADENLNQGEWVTDLKVADYGKVIDLAVPALSTQTKDMQIAAWLTEALTRQHGFAGFRDGMQLLYGFHDLFWETVHPEIDEEGDVEGRANAMTWLDTQLTFALRTVPITGSRGYSFNDFEDAKKYDFPDNLDVLSSEEKERILPLKSEAEKQRRVTMSLWNAERAETRRAAMETINFTLEECKAALSDIDRITEEKYPRNQTPGFSNLRKILDSIDEQVKKLLEEKRIEEPDEVEVEETAGEEGQARPAGGVSSADGAIAGRADALRRLAEIASFFQKTEPHSPVSYLVQRAVKWGNMGLETWLQEVIKDQSVLVQLRETLGVTDGASGGPDPNDPWA